MEQKIAIQGIKGSFHEQVAFNFFGNTNTIVACKTFSDVAKQLKQKKVDYGVMAIENSIAGAIIPNYALIDTNDFSIVAEQFLSISLNIMAIKGQNLMEIKEVHSHPIALLQCSSFFEKYPHIKLIESADTAVAAKNIKEQNLYGIAALASVHAASTYQLEIIEENVQSVESSITRFVILQNKTEQFAVEICNKASLKFELSDAPGSLATVLNVMNNAQLNLTKIQSMPIIEKPFQYAFFVDVVFDAYSNFEKAFSILELMTTHLKLLGIYQSEVLQLANKKEETIGITI